jgi:LmbE family N-acetylglucosaminyl deacetylase
VRPIPGTERTLVPTDPPDARRAAAGPVLAIGAHPDDIELGCGATLALFAAAGVQAHGVVVSGGAVGGDHAARLTEAGDGARVLGLRSVMVLGHHDTRLFDEESAILADVEAAIHRTRPSIVITHSEHDHHQDHVAVHRAVLRAARRIPTVLCFESPSATGAFAPTVYTDVTRGIEQKLTAIGMHRSQLAKPYMTADRIRGLASFRGSQARVGLAESFESVRTLLPGLRA